MRHIESFETIQEADEYVRSQMAAFRKSPDFGRMSDETFNAIDGMFHGSMAVIRLATMQIAKYRMILEMRNK